MAGCQGSFLHPFLPSFPNTPSRPMSHCAVLLHVPDLDHTFLCHLLTHNKQGRKVPKLELGLKEVTGATCKAAQRLIFTFPPAQKPQWDPPRVVGSMSDSPCQAVTISGFFSRSAKFFHTLMAPSSWGAERKHTKQSHCWCSSPVPCAQGTRGEAELKSHRPQNSGYHFEHFLLGVVFPV